MSRELPNPLTDAAAFWSALTNEEGYDLMASAPKFGIWERTKNGVTTLEVVRPQTQSFGGLNPPSEIEETARGRGYRVANKRENARLKK